MADPVTIMAAATSVMSGGLAIAEGFSKSNVLKAQSKAAEMEARNVRLQGKQAAGFRLEEMNDVIASVNVIRSGRSLSMDSATGRAIREDRRRKGIERKNAEQLGYYQKRDSLLGQSRNLRSQAKAAKTLGFVTAYMDFQQAGMDVIGGMPTGGGSGGGGGAE